MLKIDVALGMHKEADRLVSAHEFERAIPELETLASELRPVVELAASKPEKLNDLDLSKLHLIYCSCCQLLGICQFEHNQPDAALRSYDEGLRAASLTVCELQPNEKRYGDIVLSFSDPRSDYRRDLDLRKGSILYEKALVFHREVSLDKAIASCAESVRIGLVHRHESLKPLLLLWHLYALQGDLERLDSLTTLLQEALEARLELRYLGNLLSNIFISARRGESGEAFARTLKGLRLHRLTEDSAAPSESLPALELLLKSVRDCNPQFVLNEETLGGF
jgi:hypothetical protein